jgi:hypothetical protein
MTGANDWELMSTEERERYLAPRLRVIDELISDYRAHQMIECDMGVMCPGAAVASKLNLLADEAIAEVLLLLIMSAARRQGQIESQRNLIKSAARRGNLPLPPEDLEVDFELRWREHEDDWANGVLFRAPESWDGDEAASVIALRYVAALEQRCDAAGISREKRVEP